MDALATVQDVIDRWRPLTSAETTVAENLIDDATDMIRVRWPDVDSRLADGSLRPITVIRVIAGMVRRALMNRDVEGLERTSETTGPFGQSASYSNPNNNLYLSADDIKALDPTGYVARVRNGWLA